MKKNKDSLSSLWFRGMDEDEKKDMSDLLYNKFRDPVVQKLIEILEMKIKDLRDMEDFDSPSWSHKQANLVGKRSALNDTLNLLIFMKHN